MDYSALLRESTHNAKWLETQLIEAESIPSYNDFLSKAWLSTSEFTFKPHLYPTNWFFLRNAFESALHNCHELLSVLMFAVFLTYLRYIFTHFMVSPISQYLRLKKVNAQKLPEALWRFSIYTLLWCLSVHYILFSGEVNYHKNPCFVWANMSISREHFMQAVPGEVRLIYFLQTSFYVHSVYTCLYMDFVRTDFKAMLLHHAVTSSLLIFSYYLRYYKLGLLTLFVHDITDVFMEFAKINVYLRERDGRLSVVHEWLANASFVVFMLSWMYFRLYLYPLRVLYGSTWCVFLLHKDRDPPFYTVLNCLMFTMMFIHIYWFYFIVRIATRIILGSQVDDIRE